MPPRRLPLGGGRPRALAALRATVRAVPTTTQGLRSEVDVSGPSQVKDLEIPDVKGGGRAVLIDYLASGARPESVRQVGTEHE